MKAIDTHEYRGCTIEVHHDPDPESPRKWDNVGTMVCWHRRYNLGDEQPSQSPDEYLERIACEQDERLRFWSRLRESALYRYREKDAAMLRIERHHQEHLKRVLDKHFIILPLYLYDHSGITISTGKFSCPWDSGQVGFIYCTMERARDEWGEKYNPGITDDEIREKAINYLQYEVKTYDDYLNGSVYGYETKDPDGEDIGACWGYFGYDETKFSGKHDDCGYMIQCARDSIDHWLKKQAKEDIERAYWNEREVITK